MTWIVAYHVATVKMLDQVDIPTSEFVTNLYYVLLTGLPDSHDHEGDWYQNSR